MTAVLDYRPAMPEIGRLGSLASSPEADVEMRTIDPFGSEWDQLALSHPDASFFHSSAWARTLAKTYGHKPFYLSFFSSGAPQALVPMMEVTSAFTGRRGVGLPFSDCCSPLLFRNGDKSFILSSLSALASEHAWKYFELRDPRSLELSVDPAIQYFSHSLNLQPGPDALFAGFASPVRRAIRKAEKSNLSVRISQSLDSVLDFFDLHGQTRRRHGLPPQPLSFFRNLLEEAIRPGLGFVVQAIHGNRCIAAAIFFQFGRTAIYKFGASELKLQEVRANNLVMWEGIRFLARSGCESLHFGRTSLINVGLRRFKLGWGAAEELIRYFKWDTATRKWVGGRDHGTVLHACRLVRDRMQVDANVRQVVSYLEKQLMR
jgi:lipid II:glycine glycyltransferase (peptidoglycan interpeptide bridge formation enzyme)